MYVLFAVLCCLTFGAINGHHLSTTDKGVLMNDARRLLYVIGTYPEWQEKMADFKEKWGKEGEKYLNQPNVYIHGDILSGERRSADTKNPIENEDQLRRSYSNDAHMYKGNPEDLETENLNKNLIKQKLENYIKQSEDYNDILKVKSTPTRRFSNVDTANTTTSKPKKTRRKTNIKKKKINNTRKKALKDEDQVERKYPSNIDKIYNGMLITKNEDPKDLKIKNEEPKNTVENEDQLERKYPSNINKMYNGMWLRNNEDPKDTLNTTNSELLNEPINDLMKQTFINTRMKALENEGLTEEQLKRRYKNIQNMHRGLLLNDPKTSENTDLNEDELKHNIAKMHPGLFLKKRARYLDPNTFLKLNLSENELQNKLNNIAQMYHEMILKRKDNFNDSISEDEAERKYSNIAHMYRGLPFNGNDKLQSPKETKNVDNDDQLLQRRFSNIDKMYRGWMTRKNEDPEDPKTSENEEQLRRGYPNIDRMYHNLLMRRSDDLNDPNMAENEAVKRRFNNSPEVQINSFNDDSKDQEDINIDELSNSIYSKEVLDLLPENTKRVNTYSHSPQLVRTKVYRFVHKAPDGHSSETPKSTNKYIPKYIVRNLEMSNDSLEKLSHPTEMSHNSPSKNKISTKDFNSKVYKTKDYKTKDYSNDSDSNDSLSKEYKTKYNSKDYKKKSLYSKYFGKREDELKYLKEVVIPKILSKRSPDENPKAAKEQPHFSESSESTEVDIIIRKQET